MGGSPNDATLAALLRDAPDGVVLIDEGGTICWANARASELVGVPDGALIGTHVERLVPVQLRELHERHRARFAEAPRARRMGEGRELELRRADGTSIFVEIALSLAEPPHAGVVAATIRDVSERVRLLRDLGASRDETTRALTQTAAVVHELANPVGLLALALDDAAHIASDAEIDAALAEPLANAAAALTQMRHLVADLRRATKREVADHGPVRVRDVVATATRLAAHALEAAGALVTTDLEPDCEALGETGQLVQVLSNVLVNAAHAVSERSERVISLCAFTRSPWVLIEVTDTGAGIAPADLARVFEPYFSTKPSSVGMGLGLSICRNLLGEMGGRIAVSSELGVGTRVSITLPARRSPPTPA